MASVNQEFPMQNNTFKRDQFEREHGLLTPLRSS